MLTAFTISKSPNPVEGSVRRSGSRSKTTATATATATPPPALTCQDAVPHAKAAVSGDSALRENLRDVQSGVAVLNRLVGASGNADA
jgi:hypothetical protein